MYGVPSLRYRFELSPNSFHFCQDPFHGITCVFETRSNMRPFQVGGGTCLLPFVGCTVSSNSAGDLREVRKGSVDFWWKRWRGWVWGSGVFGIWGVEFRV